MTEQAAQQIAEAVAAIGEGVPMPGERGDRRFNAHDRDWRVRVRLLAETPAPAPTTNGVEAAPQIFGIVISAAPLDGDGNVILDGKQRPQCFVSTLTLQDDHGDPAGFDPDREILAEIAALLNRAGAALAVRERSPEALAAWSDPSPPAQGEPALPPSFVKEIENDEL